MLAKATNVSGGIDNSTFWCVDVGTFGRIYRGTVVIGAGECTTVQNVVIKTVTGQSSQWFLPSLQE